MKKFILTLMLLSSSTAFAHHHLNHGRHVHHGHWRYVNGGWNWVAPMIVGGVITYELTRRPVIVQQSPVIVEPPVVVETQRCSPWTEVKNEDGTITVTRTCQAQ